MSAVDRQMSWLRNTVNEHWLPIAILVIPINIAVGVWVLDWPWVAFILVVPITAAVLGWVLRPRHIWFVWIAAILILWISMGIWGRYTDPGPDETVMSLLLEAIIWMAFGVAIPLWAGRTVRGSIERTTATRTSRCCGLSWVR
jgi:hypothetical protein